MCGYIEIKYFLRSSLSIFALLLYLQSNSQSFPDELPGLELWLKADVGITITNNLISQWDDQSGNGRNAISQFNSTRPALINSSLNGLPVVSFDGNIDFMEFEEITNVRTVFWIIKESPLADGILRRPLLGHPGGLYYTRSLNEDFWDSALALPEVVNGLTRLNQENINGTNTVIPTEFSLVTLVTTGNTPASHITMEASAFGRTWWGELAELIIFSEELTTSQIQSIELYLANKYGPQYTPLPDVEIEYGFCDSTICVTPGFSSYLWSNSQTEPCIDVNTEGLYTVEIQDQFGRTFTDSIYVDFPGNISIPDTTICSGENFLWNTELNILDYDVTWSNGATTPDFSTSVEDGYNILIEDTLGCTYYQEFEITVNNFSALATLGPDLNICAGNTISLLGNLYDDIDYLWNTGETTSQISIVNSGQYSIIGTQDNCRLFDTIQVNIVGIAPQIQVDYSTACEENSVTLFAVNSSESTVANWLWIIDEINVGEDELVEHLFENSGWNDLHIIATSEEGCVTQHRDSLYVNPKPIVQFEASQLCNNFPISLVDNSTSPNGNINLWTWSVNSTVYNSPTLTFDSQGAESINFNLFIQDEIGCSAQENYTIDILSAPNVVISSDNYCLGSLTQFIANIDNTQNTNISSYQWNFGDNTTSNLPNPLHFYALANEFNVTLNITTGNGCYDEAEQSVIIYNPPLVDFQNSAPCVQTSIQFDDESIADEGDEIIMQEWNIEDEVYTGSMINHFFNTTGSTSITLSITTASGCQSTNTSEIYIQDPPIANFSFDPTIGSAPLEVQFSNESLDSESFVWIIDEQVISTQENPIYVFNTEGYSDISLIASNFHGCNDTTSKTILITEPILDISAEETYITDGNNGSTLSVRINNLGNVPIYAFKLSPDFGNGIQFSEIWSGTLLPTNELIYTFNSVINRDNLPYDFVCVGIEVIQPLYQEILQSNNSSCVVISTDNEFEVYPAFPNPAVDNILLRLINPNPEGSEVQVRVFDILGREVINTPITLLSSGYNQISLDISFLSSGQYVLQVSNLIETKSIQILKSTSP